jgi:PAS domain S-box-containing protein
MVECANGRRTMPLNPPTPDVDAPVTAGAPGDSASAIADLRRREGHLLRVNRALRTISSCSRLLIQAESETELLNVACRMIVIHGGYRMAWVGFAENDAAKTVRPVAFTGFDEGYAQMVRATWADEPRGNGPTGTAIRKGHAVVCRDVLMDPKFAPWRDDAISRGYSSTIALPIQSKGAVMGCVSIYAAEVDAFDVEEVNLLQELVNDLAYGITVLRSREDHQRAINSLRNRDALFNKLISTIPDRIYFKDRQSRFVQINESMAKRFGLKNVGDAIGKTDFDMFSEPHARQAFDDEQRIMSTGEPLIGQDEKETWPDGHTTWASTTKVPLRDADGRISGLVGISRDVTERKNLETQYLQSQKMEAFGQLAGGVAHDFNNILAAMLLQVSFIKMSATLPDEVVAQLGELEELTGRASGLTRQLLMFSRRQEMEKRAIDLNVVVQGTCSLLRRLIGEHVTLELNTSAEPLWIEADSGMVEQVMMNLCINARDAMPSGGRLLIETRAVEPGIAAERSNLGNACLIVTDTGSGMDAATRARIFEPFFTTKPVGKGTGLGLATAYGIVQQHRGWVEVESAPGEGSTFRVFLPIREKAAPSSAAPGRGDLSRGTESILLVEDDDMVRLALSVCLRRAGYSVTEAVDGAEAVRLWDEWKRDFDLLITDFLMPGGLNGAQLSERLLRDKDSLRVIVISGYAVLPDGAAIPWSKETIRLAKPFELRTLLETVRRSLDTVQGAATPAGT